MDAFRLREQVVSDSSDYIASFLNSLDPQIQQFVDAELASGRLWPDPLVQLSPAYESANTVEELVRRGDCTPTVRRSFAPGPLAPATPPGVALRFTPGYQSRRPADSTAGGGVRGRTTP